MCIYGRKINDDDDDDDDDDHIACDAMYCGRCHSCETFQKDLIFLHSAENLRLHEKWNLVCDICTCLVLTICKKVSCERVVSPWFNAVTIALWVLLI